MGWNKRSITRMRTDPYWWALKEQAIIRGGYLCEYCKLRPVVDLHHRTYVRKMQELITDVMAVCRQCHEYIHGRAPRLIAATGSLLDQGDPGFRLTRLWDDYLRSCVPPEEEVFICCEVDSDLDLDRQWTEAMERDD